MAVGENSRAKQHTYYICMYVFMCVCGYSAQKATKVDSSVACNRSAGTNLWHTRKTVEKKELSWPQS